MSNNPKCYDCGLSYSQFGLDVTLPNNQWKAITGGQKEVTFCVAHASLKGRQDCPEQ
jgi:hypothetical protein